MKKLEKYSGNKTYMFPNGVLATPDVMQKNYPAINAFPHIIETDEAGEVCFGILSLNAMKALHDIPLNVPEDEAITLLEEKINEQPVYEPPAEERIAAALEFQNLLSL